MFTTAPTNGDRIVNSEPNRASDNDVLTTDAPTFSTTNSGRVIRAPCHFSDFVLTQVFEMDI